MQNSKNGKYRMTKIRDSQPTCQSFAWTVNKKPLTSEQANQASAFIRNAVNEFGCFDGKTQKVVANIKTGMKGEGWDGAKSSLTCLCPYGMTYNPDSPNREIHKIIGENCLDVKAPDCGGKSWPFVYTRLDSLIVVSFILTFIESGY